MNEKVETNVDGKTLTLSNLEKVLYPATGFTKGEMIRYYAEVAEVMIPHLKDRPATLKRYVHGVGGEFFYEKHVSRNAPNWVHTISVPHHGESRSTAEPDIEYLEVHDRPTLVWAANLAAIEFHVPMWRKKRGATPPTNPDLMVFDLDPGEGTSIIECCHVARYVADLLGQDHLLPKTSGSKGLQLYMKASRMSGERSNAVAHQHAKEIESKYPDAVVSNMRKELRRGKILIDWSQNNPAKTTVAVYSMRAKETPSVSTPVTWDEIDSCAKSKNPRVLQFEPNDVLNRIQKYGDLMKSFTKSTSSK